MVDLGDIDAVKIDIERIKWELNKEDFVDEEYYKYCIKYLDNAILELDGVSYYLGDD